MAFWGQLSFQEAFSTSIELFIYFHDYIIILLIFIFVYVTYIFFWVCKSPYRDIFSLDSHVLEFIWTIIPIFLLFLIAFPSLYLLYLIEDFYTPLITYKIVGHQWYWEYQGLDFFSKNYNFISFNRYIVNDNTILFYTLDTDTRLSLPTKSNILFLVTSIDVLHSWTVPSLGVKVDAIPGRLNYISTRNLYSGVFFGQCREICGSNHRFIPIVLEFLPFI